MGGMQNRRRFAPTIFLVLKPFSKLCGIHCTKFECILKATLMPTNRTRGARGGSKLPRTLVSFRHCLAEPRQPRKKNTPCISDLAGVKFLLEKERVFFFRGSALQVFGQCGGATAQMAGNEPLGKMDSVLPKLFSGGKDLAKPRLSFPARRKGSGE